MTSRAANAFGDVNTVIEEDEIRQIIHPIPTKAGRSGHAVADGFEHGRFPPQLRMAGHVVRQDDGALLKSILLGNVQRRRRRARGMPPHGWTNNIVDWTDHTMIEITELAQDGAAFEQ